MKIAILAGGLGTRLSEETSVKPKPMVEIGGKPILWHIMNIYASFGFREFVVGLGYKGEVIKEYFLNYHHYAHSLTVELINGNVITHSRDIGNSTYWEREPLEKISAEGQLVAYRHENFWQCMDTLRDVHLLEKLWQEGKAPWKLWK
ncbi:NTP transferase domain-containing protein [Candidatus Villigracilis affinis]|uniref:NTP transferase domain-containing protein n=1 Tax=Candidatus Villigracilis affinis TaxID=3140682 RepID=UPI002A1C7296|nr:NTP transferase domain-containing protein [Anaerolineales bacterium]